MRVIPLGGAGEVGASSALLEVSGVRILIDAGIRTSSAGRKKPLPMLELLDEMRPDCVIVTHAHSDHTGALALILDRIGDAPIHMNIGTLHLLEVLQLDAVRHMTDVDELEGASNGVSYRVEDVERLISRVAPHGYNRRFCPVPGREDIQVMFIPCGHILGAGMTVIDTPEARILWTGDYSVAPQPTIPGVSLDQLREMAEERPFDLMVSEGTYGDAVHPPRDQEQEKLVKVLEYATRKRGKVLIPAFGVGRSQDLTALIRKAKLDGFLDGVSVYLDGMVRGVTSIYQSVLHTLYPGYSEPVQLLDPDLNIYRANGQSRAKLLNGEISEPAIVIASSGMLVGGRSVEYAKAFTPGRNNGILITGYQDEESPGRALLKLKKGGLLSLGDHGKVRVRCIIGAYQLSAHADFAQVCSVIEAVRPRRLAVVHGDPSSLKALSRALKGVHAGRADILANGKEYRVADARKRWSPSDVADGSEGWGGEGVEEPIVEVLSADGVASATTIRQLWSLLVDQGDRVYTEHEMCRMLLGHGYEPEAREQLSRTLADHRLYFLTGSATGQRTYRTRGKEEVMEMMVERSNAFQIPLERGDVVTFCDGSTDIFAAVIDEVPEKGGEVGAVVAQSSRRVIQREWVRCLAGFNVHRMLSGHRGLLARWLEDMVKEARSFPNVNPVDLYFHALSSPDGTLDLEEALEVLFPEVAGSGFSQAHQLAAALALSGAVSLFFLRPDGRFQARDKEDVARRWSAFPAVDYIYAQPPGSTVLLNTGQSVVLTGGRTGQSFGALTEDGQEIRCNYRRVVIPESV